MTTRGDNTQKPRSDFESAPYPSRQQTDERELAEIIALGSGMEYRILPASAANKRHFRVLP